MQQNNSIGLSQFAPLQPLRYLGQNKFVKGFPRHAHSMLMPLTLLTSAPLGWKTISFGKVHLTYMKQNDRAITDH
jgi:hypothetical protein